MLIRFLSNLITFVERHWKLAVFLSIASIPFVWDLLVVYYNAYSTKIMDYVILAINSYIHRMIPYVTGSITLAVFLFFYWRYYLILEIVRGFVKKTEDSVEEHLGDASLVYSDGVVRSGKTSGMKNAADILSAYKVRKAKKWLDYLKYKTMYLNYSAINRYIEETYELEKVYLTIDYQEFVDQMFTDLEMNEFEERKIKIKFTKELQPIKDILADYVEHYYVVHMRDVHVMSNTSMRNNGQMAVMMQDSFNMMKKPAALPIEKYMVVLKDEAGVTDTGRDIQAMRGGSRKDFDDGKEARLALIRHPDESTGTTISLGQNQKEISGTQMRYIQIYLKTNYQGKKDIVVYQKEIDILTSIMTWLEFKMIKKYTRRMDAIYKLRNDKSWHSFVLFISKEWCQLQANKIESKWFDYLDRFNRYKKIILKLEPIRERLEEYVLCKRPIEFHYQPESLGMDITKESFQYSAFNLNTYYMANTVYGEYNEHQFKMFRDLRNQYAEKSIAASRRWSDPRKTSEDEIRYMNYLLLMRLLDINKGNHDFSESETESHDSSGDELWEV